MSWLFILIAVVLIVGSILVYMFFKTLFRILSLVWSVIAILIVISGVFLFLDVNEFRKSFPSQPNIFLLESGGNIVAGFIVKEQSEPVPLDNIGELSDFYGKGIMESMLGSNYKMLILHPDAFSSLSPVDVSKYPVSPDTMISMLGSESAKAIYISKVMEIEGLPEEARPDIEKQIDEVFGTEQQFKNILFALFFSKALEPGPAFLMEKIKDGSVEVYPETIVFRALKMVPSSLVSKMIMSAGVT